jgi:2-polyprenyl-3-methyl-5-hydroxy-6-metoxy-1,4-benzoquinol methylase
MTSDEWVERAPIGPRTDWFWDSLGSQHVARYLWARSRVGHGLVLDVACGTGYGSALLAAPGRRLLGIDASAAAVGQANRDFASDDVRFEVGDATRLPVADSSVDFVVSFETIEHLAEPTEFVDEVARVLRTGGTLLLSTPDRDVYSGGRTDGRSNNPFHPSEMTRSELLALLQAQFVLHEVLGQCSTRGRGARDGEGQRSEWVGAARARAKPFVRVATRPVTRSGSIALRLFPRLRHQYLPATSASGEHMYVVVHAIKP